MLVGCIEEPVETTFEVRDGWEPEVILEDVEFPLSKGTAMELSMEGCGLYKLMENHGKYTDDTCEHWLFVGIMNDQCNAKAARVCVDKPLVRCFADGFITNTAILDEWKCAEGAIEGVNT